MKEIIERLEAKRKELGLSYEEVADLDKDNLSKSNVWKTLTGNGKPYFETLTALAKVLGYEFQMKEIKKLKKIETVSELVSLQKYDTKPKKIIPEDLTPLKHGLSCSCYIENGLLKREKNSKCKLTKGQHNF